MYSQNLVYRVSNHCSMVPNGGAGAKPLLGSVNTVQCQVRLGLVRLGLVWLG